jgi:hypothetical protein
MVVESVVGGETCGASKMEVEGGSVTDLEGASH